MKFEKLSKNKKQKRVVVFSIIGIILLIGGVTFYRTFALYEETKIYNVIQGRIPDFNYDLRLAIMLDGKKVESIPVKEAINYYQVDVDCDKGIGTWDYQNWRVVVSGFNTNTKCNVIFTKKEEEIEIPTNTYQIVKNSSIEIPKGVTKAICVWLPVSSYNFDFPIFEGDIVKSSHWSQSSIDSIPNVRSNGCYIYVIELTGESGTLSLSGVTSGSGNISYNYFFIY